MRSMCLPRDTADAHGGMIPTRDALRFLLLERASELFEIGPFHDRAPELRRQVIALMKVLRAQAPPAPRPRDRSP